jgi:hypothetical protein
MAATEAYVMRAARAKAMSLEDCGKKLNNVTRSKVLLQILMAETISRLITA